MKTWMPRSRAHANGELVLGHRQKWEMGQFFQTQRKYVKPTSSSSCSLTSTVNTVTKACPFYTESVSRKELSPQFFVFVHHTVPFTKIVLPKLYVEYRRFMRTAVGPFADTNWASRWSISYGWNNSSYIWPVTFTERVWKFAFYVATLTSERWTRRILERNIGGPQQHGRPGYSLETALKIYIWTNSVQKGFDNRIVDAAAYDHWLRMIIGCWWSVIFYVSPNTMDDRFCPEGVALEPASFDLIFCSVLVVWNNFENRKTSWKQHLQNICTG